MKMYGFEKSLCEKIIVNYLFYFYISIVLVIGLWPFRFNPINSVHWTEDHKGLLLEQDSIIYSEQLSPQLYKALISGEGLTIEAVLQANETSEPGLSFILACGAVGRQYNFALAQWRDHFVFFLKTTNLPKGKNVHAIEVEKIFTKSGQKHISITRDNITIKMFVNGLLVKNIKVPGNFSNWDSKARIFIGNDDSGEHSWEGNVYKIAVYDRALAPEILFSDKIRAKRKTSLLYYDFERTTNKNIIEDHGGQNFRQNLFIPEHFKVIGKTILSLPNRYFLFSMGFLKDILINISGFVPLGAIIFLRLRLTGGTSRSALVSSIILGLAISLFIEVMQAFLPLRSSSSVDLFNNTLGSFIGAYILMAWMRKGRKQ